MASMSRVSGFFSQFSAGLPVRNTRETQLRFDRVMKNLVTGSLREPNWLEARKCRQRTGTLSSLVGRARER